MERANNHLRSRRLSDAEVDTFLKESPRWALQNGSLRRRVEFRTYLSGVDFIQRVAEMAEDANHHPDLLLTWRKVEISLTSHDVGGITRRDLTLARQVEGLIRTFS